MGKIHLNSTKKEFVEIDRNLVKEPEKEVNKEEE